MSWDAQVQKAVDCYNAGATLLHLHGRAPQTGHGAQPQAGSGHVAVNSNQMNVTSA
jgi:uncharacterized protein (DUF849 family)